MSPRLERALLAALLLASFPVAVVTAYSLGEDAYITFRYAKQLALGNGLAFAPGQREEGYSNLLWVLLLAVPERLGLDTGVAARLLSVASLSGCAWLLWAAARRLAPEPEWAGRRLLLAALALLQPLLRFHLDRGLETVAYASALAGALALLASGGRLALAGALGAAAALLRPEGAAFALVPALALFIDTVNKPLAFDRARFRRAAAYAAWPIAAFALQMLFRKFHYDAWLPNTVVAKRGRPPGALWQLAQWTASTGGAPLLALAGCALHLRPGRWRPLAAGCLAFGAVAVLFLLRAGGLLNEGFRYLAAAFVPVAIGCWLLLVALRERLPGSGGARGTAAAALLAWTAILWCEAPDPAARRLLVGNGDAPRSRFHHRLLEFAGDPRPLFLLEWYGHEELNANAWAGRWIAEHLAPDALVAGDQLGQLGYFAAPTQRFHDLLGLMTRSVAERGATVEGLLEADPDHFAIFCFADSDFWPRALRGRAAVGHLQPLLDDPRVRARWAPTHHLEPRQRLSNIMFIVWSRRAEGAPAPVPERVLLGPGTDEFERWWRVRGE